MNTTDLKDRKELLSRKFEINENVPKGKVINPMIDKTLKVTDYEGIGKVIECKFNIYNNFTQKEMYFQEHLPLYVTPKDEKILMELREIIGSIDFNDIRNIVEDSKLLDVIQDGLENGQMTIFNFYIKTSLREERESVYSMYASRFYELLYTNLNKDKDDKVILIQCIGNVENRLFPVTHLIEPSRGIAMTLKLEDDGSLSKENDFEMYNISQSESLSIMTNSMLIKLGAKLKGLDYFRILAPISDLVEAVEMSNKEETELC